MEQSWCVCGGGEPGIQPVFDQGGYAVWSFIWLNTESKGNNRLPEKGTGGSTFLAPAKYASVIVAKR